MYNFSIFCESHILCIVFYTFYVYNKNMKNPFIVGRQFDPNSFLDREQETAYLLEEVEQKKITPVEAALKVLASYQTK